MNELCPSCGRGEIRPTPIRSQAWRYKTIPDLVPEEVEVPACTHCHEQWIDEETAERIEAALERAFAEQLTRKAEASIGLLKRDASQRDLENLLGLSPGYLSKLKTGKSEPSPALAAVLMLLAADPARLKELRSLWSVSATVRQTRSVVKKPISEVFASWKGDYAEFARTAHAARAVGVCVEAFDMPHVKVARPSRIRPLLPEDVIDSGS